jgi:methylated-DNA-[protein]-cysteine S-methyltransferase
MMAQLFRLFAKAHGVSFKDRVLQAVKSIPEGATRTYGDVAKMAGNPRAARAVGQIVKKNFDLEIPCHRVVSQRGIGGYNRGVQKKIETLRAEGVFLSALLKAPQKMP